MMFIIKFIFWFGLVVLLIPIEKNEVLKTVAAYQAEQKTVDNRPDTLQQLTQYCFEKPDVCQETYNRVTALTKSNDFIADILDRSR